MQENAQRQCAGDVKRGSVSMCSCNRFTQSFALSSSTSTFSARRTPPQSLKAILATSVDLWGMPDSPVSLPGVLLRRLTAFPLLRRL
eukprot:911871-Prymnesium_polylepis.1